MQNFDVQNNFLLVNTKALLVVLTMSFGFVRTGRNVVLCFQRFVQHLDQTLENGANALRNNFHPFLNIFVEHCQRFYNGLNNITNAWGPLSTHCDALSTHLKGIITAFKMHYNAVFVELYSAANDPQTGNDPQIGPQMIPNRKWSPCGPQMIPAGK